MVRGGLAVKNKIQESHHARKEKKNQKGLDDISKYQRQRDALVALDGKKATDVNKDDFIADYMSKGGSKKEAQQLWKTVSAEKKKAGSGNLSKSALKTAFGTENKAFGNLAAKYAGRAGGLALARDKQTLTKARDRARILKDYRQERFKAHQGGLLELRDMALSPLSNVDSVMGDSKFYSAFKEKSGIAPKTDWTKQTAQNVEALTKEVQGGRTDTREGFGTVNANMNKGFKNTNKRLKAANTALSAIEDNTNATKRATRRIARETDGLKARQKKVIKQNQDARTELKKAEDKLDVIINNTKP